MGMKKRKVTAKKTPTAVTLKQIIESSPVYAERLRAFAEYWAESRVFPVVMLNYLVDECGADHPEWDLRPLLARLQWIVDCPPRSILIPLKDIGEDPTPAPFYPSASCNLDQTEIEDWMIRVSPTTKLHDYFTRSKSSAHVIPFDVAATGGSTGTDINRNVYGKTVGECLFNLLMEM